VKNYKTVAKLLSLLNVTNNEMHLLTEKLKAKKQQPIRTRVVNKIKQRKLSAVELPHECFKELFD